TGTSNPTRRRRETSREATASSCPLGLGTASIAMSNSATSTRAFVATPVPIATSGSDREQRTAGDLADVVGDAPWDVDSGHVDRVLELHGRVDLADQHAIAILEQVDGEDTPADRRGRAQRQVAQRCVDRAVACRGTARGVGDPMEGFPVDRADDLVADDERPDVAPRLVDVSLQVEDRMIGSAEQCLVFEERLSRVAVV